MFYCFPKFDQEPDIKAWTPPALWRKVWWFRPSDIPVPTPIDAHHEVTYAGAVWAVSSEAPTAFPSRHREFAEVEEALVTFRPNKALNRLKESFNGELKRRWGVHRDQLLAAGERVDEERRRADFAADITRGLILVGIEKDRERRIPKQ